LKAISNDFIADLKDNIPEGLFDDLSDFEDPIKPEPSTSTKPDPAPGRKRRKAAGRPAKSKKKTAAPAKKK
jgi:hypothetical protein